MPISGKKWESNVKRKDESRVICKTQVISAQDESIQFNLASEVIRVKSSQDTTQPVKSSRFVRDLVEKGSDGEVTVLWHEERTRWHLEPVA